MPRQDGPNDETKWQARLAGEQVETHPDEPDYGFYRTRAHKGGPLVPVAYWYTEAGELRCKMNGQMLEEDRARYVWPFASVQAITIEEYDRVVGGEPWSDIDLTVHEGVVAENPRERIGDNRPPTDPAEDLKLQIEIASAAIAPPRAEGLG